MTDLQRQQQTAGWPTGVSGSSDAHVVTLESVDGGVVQMEVRSGETLATIRQVAMERLGAVAQTRDKYVIMTASGRVLDAHDTVRDLLDQGEALQLQLIPQAAFGPKPSHEPHG